MSTTTAIACYYTVDEGMNATYDLATLWANAVVTAPKPQQPQSNIEQIQSSIVDVFRQLNIVLTPGEVKLRKEYIGFEFDSQTNMLSDHANSAGQYAQEYLTRQIGKDALIDTSKFRVLIWVKK